MMNTSYYAYHLELDFHYSVMDNACGGTYRSLQGEFGSPYFPNTSPLNTYCEWKIPASAGNKISLTIHEIDIAR